MFSFVYNPGYRAESVETIERRIPVSPIAISFHIHKYDPDSFWSLRMFVGTIGKLGLPALMKTALFDELEASAIIHARLRCRMCNPVPV